MSFGLLPIRSSRHDGETVMLPEDLPGYVPNPPVQSSQALGWDGVVVQHFHNPSLVVDLPPVRDHLLVLCVGSPVLLEEQRDGEPSVRRWTERGQMTLTPAGQSVLRTLKGRAEVIVIHVDPGLVNDVALAMYGSDSARVSLRPRLAMPDSVVDTVGGLLLLEAAGQDVGSSLVADALCRSLAARLLRCHSNLANRAPEPPEPLPTGRLRGVIDQMHAHMDDALPLARLAATCGLSPSQFARSFRHATGEAPHRYLNAIRMKRARELLEKTDLSIIDIGLQCGFEWPNHFAAAFRKSHGFSPRAWRTEHQF